MYIQGGGYATNSNADYNGTEVVLASGQDIVFVNFNYRVGIFGFLAGEEVREKGDLNVGLLDQRKLLVWVKKYISKVSKCIPSRITILIDNSLPSSEATPIMLLFMAHQLGQDPYHII